MDPRYRCGFLISSKTSLFKHSIYKSQFPLYKQFSSAPILLNKKQSQINQIKSLEKDINSLDKTHIVLKASEFEKNDSFKTNDLKYKNIAKHKSVHSHEHTHSNNLLTHTHSHMGDLSQENFYKDLLSSKNATKNPAIRITIIGLLSNIGLAGVKFAGGIIYNSYALIADAIHTLTDLIADCLTLLSCKLTLPKQDASGENKLQKFTNQLYFGTGKIDTLSSLAVYSINLIAGLSIGLDALMTILGPVLPLGLKDILHIHSHLGVVGIEAAKIALVSIVIKELLFWKTKKVATNAKSQVLLANAYHHRVDSLSAMVALVSISGGYFFHLAYLDAIGGLIISGILVKSGFNGVWKACEDLLDKKVDVDDTVYKKIKTNLQLHLENMVSNNNSNVPYKIRKLDILHHGSHCNLFVKLDVPIHQKWGNVLDINEFDTVREHLIHLIQKDNPEVKNIFIEFTKPRGKQEELTEEERQFDINLKNDNLDGAHICGEENDHSHTHKH
ncbi:Mmt1 protein [Hanseniaspora uvarum]|nr:Mmt1 protein [Hanseniaspora uvarum]